MSELKYLSCLFRLCRLGKSYLILVNFLIACFGCTLVAFGIMTSQRKFDDAILFPVNILKSKQLEIETRLLCEETC